MIYIHRMHVSDLDLNLIRVLHTLLEERHVSRSAERLGLSQAATSHALGRLRKAFGDPLLVRVGRELEPTPEAERLAPITDQVMRLLTEALQAPGFNPATTTASFTLVIPDFLAVEVLPPLTRLLHRQAPGASMDSHSMPTAVGEPPSGSIDAILLPSDRIPPEHSSLFACTVGWHGLAAATNDQVSDSMTLAEFCRLPHLVVDGALVHNRVDATLAGRGLSRNVVLRLTNSELIPEIIAETDLVTIGALTSPVGPDLRSFATPLELPPLDYRITWSRRLTGDVASTWFRQRVAEVCHQRISPSQQ